MSIRPEELGSNLVLDRILRASTEEQVAGTPEPEQLERLPRLLRGVKIPEGLTQPARPVPSTQVTPSPAQPQAVGGEGEPIEFPIDFPLEITTGYVPVSEETHPNLTPQERAMLGDTKVPQTETLNAILWEDMTVRYKGEQIGTYDPQENKFIPTPEPEPGWFTKKQFTLSTGIGETEEFSLADILGSKEALLVMMGLTAAAPAGIAGAQKAFATQAAIGGKGAKAAQFAAAVLRPGAALEALPGRLIRALKTPKVPPTKPPVTPTAGEVAPEVTPKLKLPPAVQKFTDAFKQIDFKALQKAQRQIRAPELARKFGQLEAQLGQVTGRETFFKSTGALRGELSKLGVRLPEFSTKEINEIFKFIAQRSEIPGSTRLTAGKAIDRLFRGVFQDLAQGQPIHQLLPPHQVKALTAVFGEKFTQNLMQYGNKLPILLDALNIPRASLASTDLSAALRQLIFEGVRHPKNWVKMMRFSFRVLRDKRNLEYFQRLKRIQDPEAYAAMLEAKLDIPKLARQTTIIGERAEPFLSKFAEKIPWVRKSEEVFVGMIDKMMWDSWRYHYHQIVKMGGTAYDLGQMANLINYSAGRGALPSFLRGNVQSILNMAMFSPKYVFGRLRLPTMLFSRSAIVRKEAAIRLFGLLGIGTTTLKLLDMSGLVETEIDPRSSDFGKIKIGQTRLDIWSGYVQWARFFAQLATAQRKTATGEITDVSRMDVINRIMMSKESPALAAMTALLRGRDYLGNEITFSPESMKKQAFQRLVPIALQDMWEAWEEDKLMGLGIAAPSILGVGVVTYEIPKVRDESVGQENEAGNLFTTGNLARDIEERLARITPEDIDTESPLFQQYTDDQEIFEEYGDVFGAKAKGFWLKDNPEKAAHLVFWGELSMNRIAKLGIKEGVTAILESLANEFNVPLDAIGSANDGWEREPKIEEEEEMSGEEKLYHYMDVAPMWLADYVYENMGTWLNKDIDAEFQKLLDMKKADQYLIDRYDALPVDRNLRLAFREQSPEVDVALNIWGRVNSISDSAVSLLIQRASELGIPPEILPAISKRQPKAKKDIKIQRPLKPPIEF